MCQAPRAFERHPGHLEAHLGPELGRLGGGELDVHRCRLGAGGRCRPARQLGHPGPAGVERPAGPLDVDVAGELGDGGEHHHTVPLHLHEAAVHGGSFLGPVLALEAHQSGHERTDERGVTGQEGGIADVGTHE